MTDREALVRRAKDLTNQIREHQESVQAAARERRDIIITLHDKERMSDAAIAELIGLKRSAVEWIRNGRGFASEG